METRSKKLASQLSASSLLPGERLETVVVDEVITPDGIKIVKKVTRKVPAKPDQERPDTAASNDIEDQDLCSENEDDEIQEELQDILEERDYVDFVHGCSYR